MAFKPLGYYCNSTFPFIEELESEYGSYLQKMSYELKLAMRSVFASLIMLLERSDSNLTIRQLAQQACGWVVPYIDVEDYQTLTEIMDTAIPYPLPRRGLVKVICCYSRKTVVHHHL